MARRGRVSRLQKRAVSAALALVVGFAAYLGVDLSGVQRAQAPATQQASYSAQSGPSAAASGQQASRQTWWTGWDPVAFPDYYRVIGPAVVDEDVPAGEVRYAPLDGLGRAGRCVANVTYDLMLQGEAASRDGLSDLHPSGWGHNAKVTITNPDGSVYNGYLFNRSHLVAKSLGGQNRIENLVWAREPRTWETTPARMAAWPTPRSWRATGWTPTQAAPSGTAPRPSTWAPSFCPGASSWT